MLQDMQLEESYLNNKVITPGDWLLIYLKLEMKLKETTKSMTRNY